jgi:hypothetical protein
MSRGRPNRRPQGEDIDAEIDDEPEADVEVDQFEPRQSVGPVTLILPAGAQRIDPHFQYFGAFSTSTRGPQQKLRGAPVAQGAPRTSKNSPTLRLIRGPSVNVKPN